MSLPQHVAVIMDGNGRWAEKKGLPRFAGHQRGFEVAKTIITEAGRLGIKVLSLYVFSTENWRRPAEEVGLLMRLLEEGLDLYTAEMNKNQVRLKIIGRREELPPRIQEKIRRAETMTQENKGLELVLAINYGGRAEIVDAARELIRRANRGEIDPGLVDEEVFASVLYTSGLPDPDLIIRPSGEMRLSNFLLWQVAYAEFYTTSVLWPDFSVEDFRRAVESYQHRDRRFGGLSRE